jgi:hypothetical protein
MLLRWIIGVIRFDPDVYRELKDDYTATLPAILFVALIALISALPSFLFSGKGLPLFFQTAALAFSAWVTIVLLAFILGAKALPGPETNVTVAALVRTLGFAQAPGLVLVLALVPGASLGIASLVFIWVFFTTLYALRETLSVSTSRALLVTVLAFLGYMFVLGPMISTLAAGPNAA